MDEQTLTAQSGALDTPDDAGEGERGKVKRWLMELDLASKLEKDWRADGRRVKKIYRSTDKKKNTFNILWANTEVLRPNLYNQTPKPDVRRRYRDEDPVGKQVAEVLERTLKFEIDSGDFDDVMKDVVLDMALAGRGIARVCLDTSYDDIEPDDMDGPVDDDDSSKEYDYQPPTPAPKAMPQAGQAPIAPAAPPPVQKLLASTKAYAELVQWDKFRRGPGAIWADVPWIAYEHALTKDELGEKFPGYASKVNYDFVVDGADKDKADIEPSVFKRVNVWEIWDKEERKVIWIAPSYAEAPLLEEEDKLKLQGFFDIPEPLYAIDDTTSLVPVCEYIQYEEQAKELNEVTKRIDYITKGLKVRGIYDATIMEMGALAAAGDNEFIPSENATIAMQSGGMDKAIWMMPIQELAGVLQQLYIQRDQCKSVIYEIEGISDIMRGQSNPDETLGAQQLKSNNTSVRLQRRQREVQRFARDLMRIMAQIISDHYKPEFLSAISGMQVTPEMIDVLRRDLVRGIHVDIETDSTIAGDLAKDRQEVTEVVQAMGAFMQSFGPAVQEGAISMDVAKAIFLAIMRKAKFGREVEDAIEADHGQPAPQKPDPEAAQRQADAQIKAAELQQKDKENAGNIAFKQQELQHLAQSKQSDTQLKAQELQGKGQLELAKLALEDRKNQQEKTLKLQQMKEDSVNAARDREMQLVMKKMEIESAERIAAAQITASAQQNEENNLLEREKSDKELAHKTQEATAKRETDTKQQEVKDKATKKAKAPKGDDISSHIKDIKSALANTPKAAPLDLTPIADAIKLLQPKDKKISIKKDKGGNITGEIS